MATIRYSDIKDSFGSGGQNLNPGGSSTFTLRDVLRQLFANAGSPYADSTALTASLAANRIDGQLVVKLDDYSTWVWKAADASTADADHIAPTDVAAGAGRWVNTVFNDQQPIAGAALGDTSPTITVAQGAWRTLPAATLTAGRTVTLGTTGAAVGDTITLTRLDLTANTLAVVNGGAGAGTMFTFAVSKLGYGTFQYDGTNWSLRSFGTQ